MKFLVTFEEIVLRDYVVEGSSLNQAMVNLTEGKFFLKEERFVTSELFETKELLDQEETI